MTTLETVRIGGRDVPLLVAALVAQEADRLGIPPGKIGDVVLPDPPPSSVTIAGYTLSIEAAAQLAAEADARGMLVEDAMAEIVNEEAEALDKPGGGPRGDA